MLDVTLVISMALQQYLPFTVLKRKSSLLWLYTIIVATVLTVYGIETNFAFLPSVSSLQRCNSTYRLRY